MRKTKFQEFPDDDAGNHDEFSPDAADHAGARRQTVSARRNRLAQAGPFRHAIDLWRPLQARAAIGGGAPETRIAKRRAGGFADVESLAPPRSLLGSAVRGRHPSYPESQATPPRNRRYRSSCERPFSACG